MIIELDRETMPDELYNMLLHHFVLHAMENGFPVNKFSKFEDWKISCRVEQTTH